MVPWPLPTIICMINCKEIVKIRNIAFKISGCGSQLEHQKGGQKALRIWEFWVSISNRGRISAEMLCVILSSDMSFGAHHLPQVFPIIHTTKVPWPLPTIICLMCFLSSTPPRSRDLCRPSFVSCVSYHPRHQGPVTSADHHLSHVFPIIHTTNVPWPLPTIICLMCFLSSTPPRSRDLCRPSFVSCVSYHPHHQCPVTSADHHLSHVFPIIHTTKVPWPLPTIICLMCFLSSTPPRSRDLCRPSFVSCVSYHPHHHGPLTSIDHHLSQNIVSVGLYWHQTLHLSFGPFLRFSSLDKCRAQVAE